MQSKPQLSFPYQCPNFLVPDYSCFRTWDLSSFNSKEKSINTLKNSYSFVSKITDQESSSEPLTREFQSHSEPCIILTNKKLFFYKKVKQPKVQEVKDQEKKVNKLPQKQTRNVASNLLRIFLKNLIEIKLFNFRIEIALIRNGSHYTPNQFYLWLNSFNINFKNYIKSGEIKKVVGKEQPEIFKKLFVLLLKDYAYNVGVSHVLTSRRIDQNSIKMHIRGLQDLFRDIQSLYYQQRE